MKSNVDPIYVLRIHYERYSEFLERKTAHLIGSYIFVWTCIVGYVAVSYPPVPSIEDILGMIVAGSTSCACLHYCIWGHLHSRQERKLLRYFIQVMFDQNKYELWMDTSKNQRVKLTLDTLHEYRQTPPNNPDLMYGIFKALMRQCWRS